MASVYTPLPMSEVPMPWGSILSPFSLVFLEGSPQASLPFLNLPTPYACNSGCQFMLGVGLGSGPTGCASGYWPRLRGEPCGKTPPFGFAAVLPVMRNRPAMTHCSALPADVGASSCSPWLLPASPARSPMWAARKRLNRVMVTCDHAP